MTTSRTNWTRCLPRGVAAVAVPLLAMGVVLATARIAWATCITGCFMNNFYHYNDGSGHDYALDATVCLEYVRDGNINKNTACTTDKAWIFRAPVTSATRYCSKSGYRGENAVNGDVGSYDLALEQTYCVY